MSTQLTRVSAKARRCKDTKFTSLSHILTEEFLKETWKGMNKSGSAGIDKVSLKSYSENLDEHIKALVDRLKQRRYKVPKVRTVDIPKGNNKTRTLGIPTVEDRLVQRAVARILSTIYEEDFLDISYGFRPKRSPHHALKALRELTHKQKINYIFETDIRACFDKINHKWMIKMLRHRLKDPGILRLIGKWLKVGAMTRGLAIVNGEGSPQGGPISPILANIYLHYVIDLWFEKIIKPKVYGEAHLIRFADDFIIGFQYKYEPKKVQTKLQERLKKFGLEMAEEKTRIIAHGRYAKNNMEKENKRCESFDFLGFRHTCGKTRKGYFTVIRIPTRKAIRKFCENTYIWLRKHQHWRVRDQQKMLTSKIRGFYQYFALRGTIRKLAGVLDRVLRQWRQVLMGRSQKNPYNKWEFLKNKPWFKLPHPRVVNTCT